MTADDGEQAAVLVEPLLAELTDHRRDDRHDQQRDAVRAAGGYLRQPFTAQLEAEGNGQE
jgi:hypothetical protein